MQLKQDSGLGDIKRKHDSTRFRMMLHPGGIVAATIGAEADPIDLNPRFAKGCHMSTDMSGFGDYAYETVAGQCAIVAAVVIALHEDGVLPLGRYRDVLHRLWMEMPEEEAVGESGAVIERVLDLLAAHDSPAISFNGGKREVPAFDRKAASGNGVRS